MKPLPERFNILVIEDNPPDLFLIKKILWSSGLAINTIYSADRVSVANTLLKEQDINLVLLDLSLPDSFRIDSLLQIREATQKIPVIILTGLDDSAIALEALKLGAQDYLIKGEFTPDLLARCIRYSVERKNAEEKLLVSEEKYRQMFYRNPFPAVICELDNLRILEVNDAAVKKYGYERNQFLDFTIRDISEGETISELVPLITDECITDTLRGKVWQHKKKDGELILVEITWYRINYFEKIALQAQVNDVTEKIRLEKELAAEQKLKQHQIKAAVLDSQEEERKILAAELHDNVNQILATAKLFLGAALDEKGSGGDYICKSQNYVSLAIEEIRKLSKKLIIPGFILSGLKGSVQELVEDILTVKDIDIITDLEGLDEAAMSEDLKITIYRIIQEQLNNILKYAKASAVTIRVKTILGTILLSVTDNGKGFDTALPSNGIGFTNMISRVKSFNGTLEIDSSPGNGCRLKIELHNKVAPRQKAA